MFQQDPPQLKLVKKGADRGEEEPLSSRPTQLSRVSAVMDACVAQELRTIYKTAAIRGPRTWPESTSAFLWLP